jgi:monoterpene epsilon-lactone hydrolase
MSIRNFLVSRAIKASTDIAMKLTPEQRFKRNRKFMAADNSKVPETITVQPKTIAGVKVEWVMPNELVKDKNASVCFYLHGGAYIAGGMNSHRDMACYLANKANVKMLMVDYRLAPEHPYPAAHDDALAVYKAVLEQGIDPKNITIAGDSAGANLVLATLVNIREQNIATPAKAILYSPWVDLTHTNASYQRNDKKDVMLNAQVLTEAAALYAQEVDVKDEKISPLFSAMNNLPPLQIYASKIEVLVDDAKKLHEKVKAAGGESEYLQWRSAPHAFPIFVRLIPEAKKALNKSAKFINR